MGEPDTYFFPEKKPSNFCTDREFGPIIIMMELQMALTSIIEVSASISP